MAQSGFYSQQHALVQVKTEIRVPQYGSTTSATIVTASSDVGPKTSLPATDAANGKIVVLSEGMSLMKVIPFAQTSAGLATYTGLAMRIVGWNREDYGATSNAGIAARLWWPQLLADIALTPGGATVTWGNGDIGGVSVTISGMQTMTKVAGDAKIYNSSGTAGMSGGAFLVIDTCGCDRIEFIFRSSTASGSPKANLLWSSL